MGQNRLHPDAPLTGGAPVGASGDNDELRIAGVRVTPVHPDVRKVIVEEQLARVSTADSITRLATMAAALIATGALAVAVSHPLTWLVYWLVASQVVAAAFAAEHEALHGSMFHSIWANHATGIVLGLLCLCPYSTYRSYHLWHHAHTHTADDSEPALVLRNRLEYLLVVPNIVTGLAAILSARLIRETLRRRKRAASTRRASDFHLATLLAHLLGIALLVGAGAAFGWGAVAALWAVPVLAGLVIAGFLAAPEHYECAYGPAPVQITTRSTLSNPVTRFFMWNANYHAAHHLVPAVPGRNLPRLHQLISRDELVVEPSYWRYHSGLWRRIGKGEIAESPPWAALSGSARH